MSITPAVNWPVAAHTGRRLAPAGPAASRGEIADLVTGLRRAADAAAEHVGEVTALDFPAAASPVLVVDRAGWIEANTQSFAALLSAAGVAAEPQGAASALLGRGAGVQAGALLAYLAPKVLGQFDPFHRPGERRGRLLLIAPNVLAAERRLRVDPADFRLWVCLHEQTHRAQFTHTPWLADHLRDQLSRVVDIGDLASLGQAIRRRGRGARPAGESGGLIELVATPEQQQVLDRITAVMSLLEGHADVMMDRVGPRVIPSLARIRARFDERRAGRGADRIVRRWLGLDAKLRQYRDGAAFCRRVIERVGVEGFNRVFTSPNTLPSLAEIHDSDAWVARLFAGRPLDARD